MNDYQPGTARTTARRGRSGPPLLLPALALAGLTAAGAVVGAAGPRPDTSPADVLAHLTAAPALVDLGAFLLFGSAFPLVVLAATAVRRLRGLGVTAPGPLIGLAGAALAAAALTTSALAMWVAARTAELGEPAIARLLATLWFAAGGPAFVPALGLVVLGVAVPVLVLRLVPRPLAWSGAAVGVVAVLSSIGLLTPLAHPLLPVGRFGGVLFLVAVAAVLPARRPAAV